MNSKRVNQMTTVSVDCVVFGFDDNELKLLLIQQESKIDGEKRFSLPGDLVLENEDLDSAAKRVLMELTSIDSIYLKQFYAFGNPLRVKNEKDQEWLKNVRQDPNARVITVGYYALVKMEDYNPRAASFAFDTQWVNVNDIPELAFDHNQITEKALEGLREQIKYHPIGFELLPAKFTLGQLQTLNEAVLGQPLDKRNFRRKVQKLPEVVSTDERQRGVLHKPAMLYTYDKNKSEN